jgi:hypothetical protein
MASAKERSREEQLVLARITLHKGIMHKAERCLPSPLSTRIGPAPVAQIQVYP